MNIIEQIKAEIEKQIKSQTQYFNSMGGPTNFDIATLGWVLKKISTLESEKPVPKDLEEAADEYEKKHTYQQYDGGGLTPEYNATLAEAFIAGYNLCKEQMMKEAIPCKVFWYDGPLLDYTQEQQDNALERIGANVGDKVKLIIVKED